MLARRRFPTSGSVPGQKDLLALQNVWGTNTRRADRIAKDLCAKKSAQLYQEIPRDFAARPIR